MEIQLSNYAMIGDCRTAALVSKDGSIDWLCLPDFSSPSLFARLLDVEKGGYFSISLKNITHMSRRYLPETAILETTLACKEGTIRITDCMPILPDARHQPELQPLRELLRRVEVLEGSPTIYVCLDVRPGYGATQSRFHARGKLGWSLNFHYYLLNLLTEFPLENNNGLLRGELQGAQRDCFWFSLTFERGNPGVLMPLGNEADARLNASIEWWRQWCSQCHYKGEWQEQVIRSAITLRMLTFTQSGALVAAATTSLPERSHGSMNWDYRYCWPRDSAVALSAFMHLGLRTEAEAFFDWLMIAAGATRPRISNMYDVYGRSNISEHQLPWLSGYKNAKPVRIGNAVSHQLQHDVYGEVMMAIDNWVHDAGTLEPSKRALIEGFGKIVSKVWREPDNGIWEIRGERRHYLYSKVMAWYVFDSLIRLQKNGYIDGPLAFYTSEREALRTAIEQQGFNKERNCFTAYYGGDTVDASLLLLPRCGFIAYDDPRMLGTWNAICSDLERNGLILRYPPGFGGSEPGEGAFIICNFWAVNYLTGCGRHAEAKTRLKKLLSLANDVGLYSECVDTENFAALGNLPQAYSHAGLITAILRLGGTPINAQEAA